MSRYDEPERFTIPDCCCGNHDKKTKTYSKGALIGQQQDTEHPLYVLYADGIESLLKGTKRRPGIVVFPPKEAWLKLATDWAAEQKNPEGILKTLKDKLYEEAYYKAEWRYGTRTPYWNEMLDKWSSPPDGDKQAHCGSFAALWDALARMLGGHSGSASSVQAEASIDHIDSPALAATTFF